MGGKETQGYRENETNVSKMGRKH